MNPVEIRIPKGSLLDPSEVAAVVGGNVLTSQRIVDVVFKVSDGGEAFFRTDDFHDIVFDGCFLAPRISLCRMPLFSGVFGVCGITGLHE